MKNIIKIVGIGIVIFLMGVIFVEYRNQEPKIESTIVGVATSTPKVGEGILMGSVSIGPVCNQEIKTRFPTFSCVPTPEMYAAAHVLVYKTDKTTLITTVIPDAKGKFSINLPEGEYFIDMIHQRMGGTKGVPVTINITKDKPVVLKLDVDTGLR